MSIVNCEVTSTWNREDTQHQKIYCQCSLVNFSGSEWRLDTPKSCQIIGLARVSERRWGHLARLHGMIHSSVMSTGHLFMLANMLPYNPSQQAYLYMITSAHTHKYVLLYIKEARPFPILLFSAATTNFMICVHLYFYQRFTSALNLWMNLLTLHVWLWMFFFLANNFKPAAGKLPSSMHSKSGLAASQPVWTGYI